MIRFVEVGASPEETTGEPAIVRAAAWLERGGLLAHPTSTVYGIGSVPGGGREAMVNRLKGRPPDQPLILVAPDLDTLVASLPGLEMSTGARRLAAAFWPGPLTMVLPVVSGADPGRRDERPAGVAVRIEAHPALIEVLRELGGTMTSTSLNASGRPPARSGAEALDVLAELAAPGDRIGLLDSGELPEAPGSTIVSLTGGHPELIREGALDFERVLEALGSDGDQEGAVG